ncbi:MAG: hypothetical protein JNM70_18765, partial [Anaerolineae bacterium]|nr:hypothetical protein [Anaerolineae bacterium]
EPPADPLDPFIPSMIAEANYLLGSIRDVVDEAPLHQRVIALVQIIDRIERLDYRAQARAARLNIPSVDEDVNIVYEYEVEGHVEKEDDLDEGFPEPGYISAWPAQEDERQNLDGHRYRDEEPPLEPYPHAEPGF